jgi:SAM-dependent methyltransferase
MADVAPLYTDRTRAEVFGSIAALYERYRPSYPKALLDDLVALGARTVLDVGCGTGKAAVLLAARGLEVLGVEIDPKMAELARSHDIPVEVSSFEGWDAAGRTFDLLTCGQAWHWVNPERGIPKAATVVRPGGAVGLFWNYDRLDERVQSALDAVYAEHAPELLKTDTATQHREDERPHADAFARHPGFASVETRQYRWQRGFTADEWVGMTLTHSDHLLLPAGRRRALADAAHAAIDRLGGFVAQYGTYLMLARRAD